MKAKTADITTDQIVKVRPYIKNILSNDTMVSEREMLL